jgi:hypothetical protein
VPGQAGHDVAALDAGARGRAVGQRTLAALAASVYVTPAAEIFRFESLAARDLLIASAAGGGGGAAVGAAKQVRCKANVA